MAPPYSEWRLISPEGIRHSLIEQSGGFGRENADWRMVIRIRSIDLAAFVNECFPAPRRFGAYVIYPRRFYPAGLPALECKDIDVEGFTSGRPIDPFSIDSGAPDETYEEFLRVTINFGPCPSNDEERDPNNPTTWLDISSSASGEYLTSGINQDDLQWQDADGTNEAPDEKDSPFSQSVPVVCVEWTCKWPQVPYEFYQDELIPRMRNVLGRVNNGVIEMFGDAPAETILFLTYQDQYEYTWRDGYSGASPVEVTLKFLEKNFQGRQKAAGTDTWQDVQVTHNHLWRPNHGWQRPLVNGEPIHASADLMNIFTG